MGDIQTTSIRISKDLHDRIRKVAKRERRSISQQILLCVEKQLRKDFPNQEIEEK